MTGRQTHITFGLLLFWITVAIVNIIIAETVENNDGMFVLKIRQNKIQEVFWSLREYNFTHLYQITPSTHIFQFSGPQKALYTLPTVLRLCCRDKIIRAEHLREYRDTLRPVDSMIEELIATNETDWLTSTNLVCDNYYGMGVHEAWSLGYTGRGVTIAVTDVGVNTDLEDLKDNINATLSFNFVEGNTNVTPEYFHNIRDKASTYTDHGNKVASIIAAIKGNNICSAGIAYNAKLIALKIFRVTLFNNILGLEQSHWTRSNITSRALSYQLNNIDIFANAWAPTQTFDTLDLATRAAIKDGAENGRRGLGSIYVVPSGPPGNELSNNIYTITVNSIGRYGTVPKYTNVDASVLTSGLGDGNNLTSSFMVTTTLKNACVTGFKGVSAATSQIAAVIALALEANPNLSLRDVQHLLANSSDKIGLQEEKAFKSNAAGNFFHDVFGFGLINADKLVSLAATYQPAPRLRLKILKSSIKSTQKEHKQFHAFCYTCKKVKKRHCLATVEHVRVKMKLKSTSGDFSISITSPSGTQSVLIDQISTQEKPLVVKKLNLVSVHFWGELAFGSWTLTISDGKALGLTEADKLSLTIYGTNKNAKSNSKLSYGEICDNDHSNKNDTNTTSSKIVKETSSLSSKTEDNSIDVTALKSNPVCDDYCGLGVPEAWSLGYSGRGVTIAVTDVGVNTDLKDLKDNINYLLSYNFVDGNKNVAPEYFPNINTMASTFTDHGNKVTSIIAAVKGNNICGTGIAYNAKIAVLKIFKVRMHHTFLTLEPSHWSRSDVIPRALSYQLNEIDIFANAWATAQPFDSLDLITREAIRHGAENGRHGLGNIYVVPSGPPGSEFSNSIYTITVNSIGRNGTVPKYSNVDASVLTCGLGDGHSLTSSFMVTTTLNNACVTGLNGVSAATSQIAAIIALAIEANNNLSHRDVLHLLVHASDNKGLQEEKAFRRNAAGKFFHDVLGFGLIDAGKLVKLAVKQQPVSRLMSKTLTRFEKRIQEDSQIYQFCNDFKNMMRDRRLNTVEQVLVKINFISTAQKIRVLLKSPLGTTSLLMDYTSQQRLIDVDNVKLISVHFWGELPFGSWSLIISDHQFTKLRSASLTLYGTSNDTASSYQDEISNEYICDNI